MAFEVPAPAYDRFMGRFSEPLADGFVEVLGLRAGMRALDVGAGTGALTVRLLDRLGPRAVAAIEPSPTFAAALRERLPAVDVREASADAIPFADGAFDVAAAQLVVNFFPDVRAGLQEIARVVAPGGIVAACLWDFAGGRSPLSPFWHAAKEVDPAVPDEAALPIARPGALRSAFVDVGLSGLNELDLRVAVPYDSFDDWWRPYTEGVGPAGDYLARIPAGQRDALRERCARLIGTGRGVVHAGAVAVVGRT